MLSTVLLSVVLFISTWWSWRRWLLLRKVKRIPMLPGALPIIGHAHKFMGSHEKIWSFVEDVHLLSNIKGGVIKSWFGPKLNFFVTDPSIAQTVLNTSLEKMYVYKFNSSWLGQGLITADVPTWKRHRKLLNPTFNQQLLNGFMNVFNSEGSILVDNLERYVGQEVDVLPILINHSFDSICQTALGIPATDRIFAVEFSKALTKIIEIMAIRMLNIWMHLDCLYFWTITHKEENEAVKSVKKTSTYVLNQRKAILKNLQHENMRSEHRFKPFIDVLLEMRAQGQFTDNYIIDEVNTIIAASSETTSISIFFTLSLLGSHLDVQERAYKEIQEVLGGSNGDITKDDLKKLSYVEAVIKESLRILPAVPVIARELHEDVKTENVVLPAGCSVMVLVKGINTQQCWGEDANLFKPERWLDTATLPGSSSAFAPFSLGRRACIGQTYAMLSMKITLAHILRRCRVVSNHYSMKLKWDILLKPASGHLITLHKR